MTDDRRAECLDANMLAEYIDGTLGPRERAEVEAHLADCAECYEAFADAARASAELGVPAAAARPPRGASFGRRWAPLAAAALVCVAAGAWWFSPGARLARAESQLASASAASHRLSPGRLSIDRAWATAAPAVRGPADRASAGVRAAAATLETLAADATDARSRHARALALLAAGDAPAAVAELRRAIDDAGATAARRNDLAAALLEAAILEGRTEQVAAALHEASLATALDPGYQPAWFTRAMAAETLGPTDLAIAAWRDYLAHDASSAWSAEARDRLAKLERASGGDARTRAQHDVERRVLPAWRAAPASAEAGAVLTDARRTLTESSADRELLDVVDRITSIQASAPAGSPASGAIARVIDAHGAWLAHYERGDSAAAARDADAERAARRDAELPTAGADARGLLAGDRNAAYDRIPSLASELESRQYFRTASLLFISRGSTSLRRRAWSTAIDDYREGLRLAEAAHDRELAGTAHALLADAYRDLGDTDMSWAQLRLALDDLPSVANSRLAYSILRAAVDAAHEAELPGAAVELAGVLAARMQTAGSPTPELLAHLDRALALQNADNDAAAAVAIDAARRLLPEVRDPSLAAECAAELALTSGRLEADVDPRAAVSHLTDTLATFEGQQTVSRIAHVLLIRGTAYQRLGRTADAERDWERGVALVADDDLRIRDEQLRISRRDAVWSLFGALTAARLDRPVLALETTERARARELLDSLAPGQQIEALHGEALWTWIPPGATALVFAVLPDELAIWRLDQHGATLTRRPITERALERLVDDTVAELRSGVLGAAATRLAADVLSPLADQAPGPLLVIPDGALHRVPFASLPGVNGQRLVANWTPVIAPSLGAARAVAAAPAATGDVVLAGYGAARAAESLRALPGVDRELDALRTVYPAAIVLRDADATPAQLTAAATRGRVLHVAAHGIANALRPSASRFELAGGTRDHEWRPEDIAALTLPHHPVVVLSGCDTATGRVFRGEGAMSLARPFLAAGSAAVVGTLWALDDTRSPDVTVEIHRNLNRGMSAPAAVAAAQRTAMAAGVPTQVWAAFAVMGGFGRDAQ